MPIDTFVVLMMENRSFDHYFGWYDGADARNAGLSYPDPDGNMVATHHLTSDFQGCDFRDPSHSWDGGRWQFDRGKLDGFVQGTRTGPDLTPMRRATTCAMTSPSFRSRPTPSNSTTTTYCSIMASTYPNRHFQLAAQNGGQKGNELPPETKQTTASPGRRSSTVPRERVSPSPTTSRTYRSPRSTERAAWPRSGPWPSSTRTLPPERCRRSASSTRPSATGAAATGSPPTSTRTATSASAKPSCRTSSTPSWSRPSTGAARSSSTTTSGAASSTT